jgi:hypothetical protein
MCIAQLDFAIATARIQTFSVRRSFYKAYLITAFFNSVTASLHSSTVLSQLPEAKYLPSPENEILLT